MAGADGDIRYALSNAHAEEPLERLAWMEAARCFVECSIQDAKSELGWDEFQAQKLSAWEYQLMCHCRSTILLLVWRF